METVGNVSSDKELTTTQGTNNIYQLSGESNIYQYNSGSKIPRAILPDSFVQSAEDPEEEDPEKTLASDNTDQQLDLEPSHSKQTKESQESEFDWPALRSSNGSSQSSNTSMPLKEVEELFDKTYFELMIIVEKSRLKKEVIGKVLQSIAVSSKRTFQAQLDNLVAKQAVEKYKHKHLLFVNPVLDKLFHDK